MYRLLSTNKKISGGFTLVEMLVYVGILSIVLGSALTAIFSFSDQISRSRANRLVLNAGETALERILTEARLSTAVDVPNSDLGTHPGVLTLTKDTSTTMSFALSSGVLEVLENGVSQGPLTPDTVIIDNVEFRHFDNGFTELVAVDMTLSATSGEFTSTRNFNAAVVLRGSYE